MKIAICDDEAIQVKFLSMLIQKWADKNKKSVLIKAFDNADAFQFSWVEDKSFDVLLLDIQMPGQNGMELAKAIRKNDDNLIIIFITGFSDYIDEGYDVSALHYLIKPVKEEKLFLCLDKANDMIKKDIKTILVECGGENFRILQDDIIYIEAFAHSVVISTSIKRYEINESIGELESKLDPVMFFRPHRSFIVGLKYIRKISKNEMTLDSGEKIPVSRRRYQDANRAFINYYRG